MSPYNIYIHMYTDIILRIYIIRVYLCIYMINGNLAGDALYAGVRVFLYIYIIHGNGAGRRNVRVYIIRVYLYIVRLYLYIIRVYLYIYQVMVAGNALHGYAGISVYCMGISVYIIRVYLCIYRMHT